jgi:hypothetical protein
VKSSNCSYRSTVPHCRGGGFFPDHNITRVKQKLSPTRNFLKENIEKLHFSG